MKRPYNRAPCPPPGFDHVIEVPERDHTKLENRDQPNQHPIKAISGLRKELNTKLGEGDTLTNEDLLKILV